MPSKKTPTPLAPPDGYHADLRPTYTTPGRKTYCLPASDPTPTTHPDPDNPTKVIVEGTTLCGTQLEHVSFALERGMQRQGLTLCTKCNAVLPDEEE